MITTFRSKIYFAPPKAKDRQISNGVIVAVRPLKGDGEDRRAQPSLSVSVAGPTRRQTPIVLRRVQSVETHSTINLERRHA